jgi:hypothetical protein
MKNSNITMSQRIIGRIGTIVFGAYCLTFEPNIYATNKYDDDAKIINDTHHEPPARDLTELQKQPSAGDLTEPHKRPSARSIEEFFDRFCGKDFGDCARKYGMTSCTCF